MISSQFLFDNSKLRTLIASRIGINANLVRNANTQVDVTNTPFYVTLQQTTSTPQGSRVYQDNVSEIEYSKVTSNVLYSIQIIGKNALMWANRLQPSFRLTSTLSELKKMNIGILQMSAVRDLSGAYDAGYEERAQFDLLVSQDTIVKEQLNNVLTAEIDIRTER